MTSIKVFPETYKKINPGNALFSPRIEETKHLSPNIIQNRCGISPEIEANYLIQTT